MVSLSLPLFSSQSPKYSQLFACFLGWLCGFPVGAQTTAYLYRHGILSQESAQRWVPFVTGCSPSFALLGIGTVLAKDISFGILLLLSQWCSGCLVYLVTRKKTEDASPRPSSSEPAREYSFFALLPESVGDASQAMLHICAMTVFFEVVSGCVRTWCEGLSLPSFLSVLCIGILEFSGGVMEIQSITSIPGAFCCGLFCAFGGICVAFQVRNAAKELFSFRQYLKFKLLQGILCGFFCALGVKLF